MTIDRLGLLSSLRETSADAVGRTEFYHAIELAMQAPEVRVDRIAELKACIADPAWINATLARGVPDSLVDAVLS